MACSWSKVPMARSPPAICLQADSADWTLERIESSHNPSLVKMCDGMWRACGASGAICAYARAAGSASAARSG